MDQIIAAAMEHYEAANVGSKQVKNLTPYDVISVLLVEYEILRSDKSPFCQAVTTSLHNIPINKPDGTTITLDLVQLWCELFSFFMAYDADEFAIATFKSMYSTRVDRETTTFDPNFHISGKEAFSISDDTAFTKLVKMWNFLMSEMFYRFFYTYDFRTVNTERAYYTVMGDATKRKRTTSKFCEFLLGFRPMYAQLCMLSPEKREIYSIFTHAAAYARQLRELKMKKLEEKRAGKQRGVNAPIRKVHESHTERITRLNMRLKEMDIIMGRIPALEKIAYVPSTSATVSQPPKTVWKLPVPGPAPAPAPAPGPAPAPAPGPASDQEDDGFTTVIKGRTQKPATRSHQAGNL
jgi:hypothetical protein